MNATAKKILDCINSHPEGLGRYQIQRLLGDKPGIDAIDKYLRKFEKEGVIRTVRPFARAQPMTFYPLET